MKAEVDSGKCPGVSSEMAEKMKALEREKGAIWHREQSTEGWTFCEIQFILTIQLFDKGPFHAKDRGP